MRTTQLPVLQVGASLLSAVALVLALGAPAAAQLADGPWSMFHHDVCHTGQSPYLGPLFAGTPTVPGVPAATDVKFWHGFDKLRTSPSLSGDGKTIYFGMGFKFCSVDTATMVLNACLQLPADVSDSSPAVGADGTIYMGDRDNSLNAFTYIPATKALTLKWRYNHGHEGDIWQHTIIAPGGVPEEGTIYFTHDQSTDGAGIFTALRDVPGPPDPVTGAPTFTYEVKWKYKIGNFVRQSSPAIDQNGVIYFGDLNGYAYAFEDRGACMDKPSLRLEPPLSSSCNDTQRGPVLLGRKLIGSVPGITASPVISADSNTLYVGTNTGLKALDIRDIRDPENCWVSSPPAACAASPVLWTFATTGKVDQTPALGRDGTLYVPVINFGQKSLYAVKPDGNPNPKWVFGPINTGSETSAYPIVAGDDKVYVSLGNTIYALDPNTGTPTTPPRLLWKYATTNFLQSSPLIGPVTGTGSNKRAVLYVPGRDTNLYAISSGLPTRPDTFTPTTCWADSPTVNHNPVAHAGNDKSVPAGPAFTSVTFQGSGTDSDGDSPLTFTWNFGDGQAGSGPSPTHSYATANPGVYTATLTVSDGHGGSGSDSVNITVTGGPPTGPNFLDNFNRGNSTSIGTQWVEAVGDLKIEGNQLKNVVRGDNIAHVPAQTGAIQSAAANFISVDNNTGPRLGLLLRYKPEGHYRLYLWTGGTNQLRISRIAANGAETVLKSTAITPAPAAGTPFHLVVSASGTRLKATIGLKSVEVDDATYTSGTIGVFINPGAAVGPHIADDFCASIGGTCP